MPHSIIIRPESSSDSAAITNVIDAAFLEMPYSEGDEAELVNELRRLGALSVSLVAEIDKTVVGHIWSLDSPAQSSDGTSGWYGLGPLAVLPMHQNAGIGSALLGRGLEAIANLGANGCILIGHPHIYAHFGFKHAPSNAPSDQPQEFFMVKLFCDQIPYGPIYFHEAFKHLA
jgi:putative acetyltransferase